MTAELAVLLPVVVLAIVLTLAVAAAGVTQVRCADAARAAARSAALGEGNAEVQQIAHQLAGDGAQVEVSGGSGWVTVSVHSPIAIGPLHAPIDIHASFQAKNEPGVGP